MASLSLRIKILISLILVTLLFACGMVLFSETFIYHKLHDKLREKGIALAKRVAADCVNPVITERYFELTMMFKDLMASEPDIVYVYVLSEDGRELAHTFAKGLPKELKLAHEADPHQPYSSKDLSTDKGIVHDIAVPLLKGQIGLLHLGLSESAITQDVEEIVTAIVAFSVTVLLAGIIISVGFSRTITAPMVKLARAAEAFGRGELDRPIVVTSDDEFGDLARIFNTMIEKRRQAEAERERLILELQAAIRKVKTLSGLLPLCSSCKKIRDDKGYWNQIDAYISEHSEAEISHSLCPECAKKLYPGIWERIRKQKE